MNKSGSTPPPADGVISISGGGIAYNDRRAAARAWLQRLLADGERGGDYSHYQRW